MAAQGPVRCRLAGFAAPNDPEAALVRMSDQEAGIACAVLPGIGAEIASLRVRHRGRWREILHRGLEYGPLPPERWDGRAPLLWPAGGRCITRAQAARAQATGRAPRRWAYTVEGRTYPMPCHGFARHMRWKLAAYGVEAGRAFAVCTLRQSPQTRAMYPFDFTLSVRHTLCGRRIVSRYEVSAGENGRPMPFMIGNHVGFNLPLLGRGTYAECTVRTPGARKRRVNASGGFSGRTRAVDLSKPTAMASGIYRDSCIGGYSRRAAWAELADPNAFSIRVSQAEKPVAGRRLSREEDLLFVLWGVPERGCFCPEPWLGAPNALNSGKGCLQLAPGDTFVWEMRIEVGACKS